MSDQATAPAAKAAERHRTITHSIGDVVVSVSIPADCPDPFVALYVHSAATTARERHAMIHALGVGNLRMRAGGDSHWLETHDVGDDLRATVFFPADEVSS